MKNKSAQKKEHFLSALSLKSQGNLERAITDLHDAIQWNPNFYRYYYELADILERQEDFEAALRCYKEAIGLNPSSAWCHYKFARVLVKLDQHEKAIDNYIKSVHLNPYVKLFYEELEELLMQKSRVNQIIDLYRRVLEIDSNLAWVHHKLGQILLLYKKDINEAKKYFHSALELDPTNQEYKRIVDDLLRQKNVRSQSFEMKDKNTKVHPIKFRKTGIVVYGLHKSATMFLYRFFKDLSEVCEIKFFSENNEPQNHQKLDSTIDHSFCLCPVRSFNFISDHSYPNIDNIYHIVQVRDPRDILVSEYFSWGWTHYILEHQSSWRKTIQSMTPDEYVFTGEDIRDPLKPRYDPLIKVLRQKISQLNITVVKYEDMVLDFRTWLSKVITPFGCENEQKIIDIFYDKYSQEFNVNSEQLRHKRRVIPGDHINKLKPETIEKLNERYQEILHLLDYRSHI